MSTISGGTRGVGIGVADYVVFGVSLVIPVIISLYYCCIKKQTSNSDFLMGNRSINAIPMSFSLCASYMSAVIITGKYQKVQSIIARIIYNFNCMNISLIMIILYFCFSFRSTWWDSLSRLDISNHMACICFSRSSGGRKLVHTYFL